MIRQLLTSAGEGLVNVGSGLLEEAEIYRAEQGNPKELPERNIYDTAGERMQFFGHKLLDFANSES